MATVLIVEDNEMNRDMLSRRLGRKGFEILLAGDGKQGVEIALAQKPDVVLMDLSLPEIDGLEASRRIKASMPSMPIIALTAHAMESDRASALAAGCNDFDTKPVDLERLLGKIQQQLDGKSAHL